MEQQEETELQRNMLSKWKTGGTAAEIQVSPTLNSELLYHCAPPNWSSCLHSGTPVQESLHYIKFLSWHTILISSAPQISSVTYYGFQKEVELEHGIKYPSRPDSISFLTGPPYVTFVSATNINPQLLYWACYHTLPFAYIVPLNAFPPLHQLMPHFFKPLGANTTYYGKPFLPHLSAFNLSQTPLHDVSIITSSAYSHCSLSHSSVIVS